MEVNSKLVIITRDYLRGGQTFVLSTHPYKLAFPTIERDKSGHRLRELLSQYVHLDMHWINPQLLEVLQEENSVDVYYCGMIPHDTPLTDAFMLGADNISKEEVKLQQIVMRAVNKL